MGVLFFFLAPSSLLSFRSVFWLSFCLFFSRGIWRFSRLTLLGWLALRRRPGAPCLLGASGGQLQRPLLLFLLPLRFFLSCPFFSSSFFTLCRKKKCRSSPEPNKGKQIKIFGYFSAAPLPFTLPMQAFFRMMSCGIRANTKKNHQNSDRQHCQHYQLGAIPRLI